MIDFETNLMDTAQSLITTNCKEFLEGFRWNNAFSTML
jgi:hypothetical protein